MTSAGMSFPALIRVVLCATLLGLAGPCAAQDTSAVSTPNRPAKVDSTQHGATQADSLSADSEDEVNISVGSSESVVETILEFILLAVIIGLALIIVSAFVGGFAAVSIFMETGCLRFIVFGLGWIPASLFGFLVGIFVGEATGLDFLTEACAYLGFWGYPFGWGWGLYKVNQLPEEEYVTWKRTLTSGALLGAGAGSALNLTRSAAAVFKGGGGSFGGGGASGSFGSAQAGSAAAAAPAASIAAASGGGGTALGAAGGGAVVAVESATSGAVSARDAGRARDESSWIRRRIQGIVHWMQRLRWYHGCAFVLVALIFIPVGLGAAAWMQDPKVLIFVIATTVLVTAYRLWKRWAVSSVSTADRSSSAHSSFRGGGASASWN